MKRIIPLVAILAILLSLFALSVGAAPIPEDEIFEFLPIYEDYFMVPKYVPRSSDWAAFYTVPDDFVFDSSHVFDKMYPFFSEFGDALPEGFAYCFVVNGVEYYPNFIDDQGLMYYGNAELIFGHEYRDHFYEEFGGWPDDLVQINYEYDKSAPFYLVMSTTSVRTVFFDDSLADGFTMSSYAFFWPKVESVNYEDYAIGSSLSGGGSSIVVSFPAYWSATHVRDFNDKAGEGDIYYGAGFSHVFRTIGVDNHIQTYPFGWFFPVEKYYYYGKALYAGNIPDGSKMTFTYTLRMKCEDSWLYEPENPEFLFRVAHVAEPGVTTYIENGTYKVLRMEQTGGEYVMTVECSYTKGELQYDAEYLAFCCGFDLGVTADEHSTLEFTLDDAQLEIGVEALVAMLMETQKTNKLLDEVVSQLAEQGKTLDEILSGSDSMNNTADQIAGNVADKVQQGNQLMDSLDAVERPIISGMLDMPGAISGVMPNYLSSIVREFGESDLVYQMLTMAGLLMLASYILFGKKV